jgi:hypothetical protein
MPKPKGWSDAQLAARDRCVTKLTGKGMDKSKAYAICTASVEGTTNRGGK